MRIGVPKEIKVLENRVGLTPESVREVVAHGHEVVVEHNAGQGIGMDDTAYQRAGATVAATAAEVFAAADMIVKVKEPQAARAQDAQARPGAVHLSASRAGSRAGRGARRKRCGLHRLRDGDVAGGGLPLLAPMSEVAGRMAVQAGAYYLEKPHGGLGMLLGGVPGVDPAKVVVLGGGVVGTHAIDIALGMGADVWVLDRNVDVLRRLWSQFGRPLNTVFSTRDAVERHVIAADLVIGGVLIPGAEAPKLVSRELVSRMKHGFGRRRRGDRPGRLLRDVASDDARGPGVCRRRGHPLLCREHAGGRSAHVDVRAQQRDAAVRAGARVKGWKRALVEDRICAMVSTSRSAR